MELVPLGQGILPTAPSEIDYIEIQSSCPRDPSVIFHISNVRHPHCSHCDQHSQFNQVDDTRTVKCHLCLLCSRPWDTVPFNSLAVPPGVPPKPYHKVVRKLVIKAGKPHYRTGPPLTCPTRDQVNRAYSRIQLVTGVFAPPPPGIVLPPTITAGRVPPPAEARPAQLRPVQEARICTSNPPHAYSPASPDVNEEFLRYLDGAENEEIEVELASPV